MVAGFLETNNLLGIIVILLGTLNVNTQMLKTAINKSVKLYSALVKYLKADIEIRARLERKANWLMEKFGVDIEKFNIDALDTIDEDFDLNDF